MTVNKNKTLDHLAAIVLAARDHLAILDAAPARAVVDMIDAWASDRLPPGQPRIGYEQLSGTERDMRAAAVDAIAREKGLGDHLLGVADWTPTLLGAARMSARAGAAMFTAGEALARAARQASEGQHARIVAASAMTAVECVAEARLAGAVIR